jgi:CelD/BcsL family acetyltransferase involved in cellulose biosynthesis
MQPIILKTLDDLRPYEATWKALPLSNPFSSWEYARGWLARPSVQPFVIVVKDDANQVIALAPWCLQTKRGGIRQLEGIRGYDAWYHDPWVKDPDLSAPLGDLLFETLLESRGEWDSLDLILNGERSPRLIQLLEGCGWGFAERPNERQNRMVDLSQGWEAYWNSRPAKFRSSMRQAQRKLDALPHRYIEADAESYQPILEAALRFSQDRWDPAHNRDDWYQAIRDLADWSAPRGSLCAFGLEIQGRIAAARVLFRSGDRAYGTIQTYDPEFSAYRVGSLMTVWAFERLAATGILSLDLGDGVMEWKERMSTGLGETVLVQLAGTLSGKALMSWKRVVKPQLAGILAHPVLAH